MCLCFHVRNVERNTLTRMHIHTLIAQPLNTADTTLGSTVPHDTSRLNDS